MYEVIESPPVSARFSPAGAVRSARAPWGRTSAASGVLAAADRSPGAADASSEAAGASHVASARVRVPSTAATFSFSGSTATFSRSAVAAAVRDVVRVVDRSSRTSPTPGTFTSVGPAEVSVTRLPSTVTEPGRVVEARGALPASQTAFAVTFSSSISPSSGSPGTWTRALARVAEASARFPSTVAPASATSARSTVNGRPPSTPSNRAVSAVSRALCGARTSLRETVSGACTVLLSRDTSSSVRSTAAPAVPCSPVACAAPAPVSTREPAARTPAAATAAGRRAGMRKVALFKVVGPPGDVCGTRKECPRRKQAVSDPATLHSIVVS